MKQTSLLSPEGAEALLPGWQRLAETSLVPAGLISPQSLRPQLQQIGGARLAVVSEGEELHLALPIAAKRFPPGLSASWTTPLNISGTPLISAAQPEAALSALLSALPGPLLLSGIETSGAFWQALLKTGVRQVELQRWQRASLNLRQDFKAWMNENFSQKRRKEYRRLLSRLGEQGQLEQISYQPGEEPASWIEALLHVESSGWKGERGTALAAEPARAAAARGVLQNLAAAGGLRLWMLRLDGKPIAVLHAVVERDQAWLGKIGYDQDYAKFSPGVLLLLFATEQLMAEEALVRADSCAIPDHPMIDNIWRDRIEVADVVVAPGAYPVGQFRLITGLERLRRLTRGKLRDAYYTIRGRHRS